MNKQHDFIRYVALLASRVTAGETDPAGINWRYLRDQAAVALACHDGPSGGAYERQAVQRHVEGAIGQGSLADGNYAKTGYGRHP